VGSCVFAHACKQACVRMYVGVHGACRGCAGVCFAGEHVCMHMRVLEAYNEGWEEESEKDCRCGCVCGGGWVGGCEAP
jgi:hypothetical protein